MTTPSQSASSNSPPSTRDVTAVTAHLPGHTSATSTRPTELSNLTLNLRRALRQYPDFPKPGILFEDILPIFSSPTLHSDLIRALELHVLHSPGGRPDVIVGLEARGFLFGPSLALRLNAGFVPARKGGKLPGSTIEESFEKEYGMDAFQMQTDAITPGQKVLVVDDIIATGKPAPTASMVLVSLTSFLDQVAPQPQLASSSTAWVAS